MQCCTADRATFRRQQEVRGKGCGFFCCPKLPHSKTNEEVYEDEISSVPSSARAWTSFILAGKRGSRRHSTMSFSENVVVAETSYQMLEVLSFCDRERAYVPSIKITVLTFLLKKGVSVVFENTWENVKSSLFFDRLPSVYWWWHTLFLVSLFSSWCCRLCWKLPDRAQSFVFCSQIVTE